MLGWWIHYLLMLSIALGCLFAVEMYLVVYLFLAPTSITRRDGSVEQARQEL